MTNTKKSFITAGAIIGIVESALMILAGIILFSFVGVLNEEFIISALEAEQETKMVLTDAEISYTLTLMRTMFIVMGSYIILMASAMLAFSIVVLKNKSKGVYKKGFVITLLVLSALNGNILTAAFMIVTLCLKDKTAIEIVQENIQK